MQHVEIFYISVTSEMNVHIIRISYPMITRYNEKKNFLFYEVSENEKKVFARIALSSIWQFRISLHFPLYLQLFRVKSRYIPYIENLRSFERIKRQ